MESGALSDDSFNDFADNVVLFLHNTSRVEDEPYPKLLSEKGGRGFPYLVFMDAEGDVITPHKSERSTKGFNETLAKVNDVLKLEKLAKAGDKSAETPLFIAKVKLARYNFVEASAKRKKLPSESKSQKQEIDGLLFDLQIDSILSKVNRRKPESFDTAKESFLALKKAKKAKITKEQTEKLDEQLVALEVNLILSKINRRDPDTKDEAIKKLLAMRKAGRTPQKGRAAGSFWRQIMGHAFQEEDVPLAQEAFDAIKKAYGKSVNQSWVDRTQERLDDLKEKVKDKGK